MPWMALVIITRQDGNFETCGGSVLNSRFVLTAAHCFCGPGARLCDRIVPDVVPGKRIVIRVTTVRTVEPQNHGTCVASGVFPVELRIFVSASNC